MLEAEMRTGMFDERVRLAMANSIARSASIPDMNPVLE
jgi:hypothetical protein